MLHIPRKHRTLNLLCWFNVGPPSATSLLVKPCFIFRGNGIPTGCRRFSYPPGSISLDCRNLRLKKTPSYLPEGIAQLLLSGNNIAEVPRYAFWGCEYLAHLDMSFNQISTLYNECFSGLIRLKDLILKNNIINSTNLDHAVFLPIGNLEVLAIGNNDNNKFITIMMPYLKILHIYSTSALMVLQMLHSGRGLVTFNSYRH